MKGYKPSPVLSVIAGLVILAASVLPANSARADIENDCWTAFQNAINICGLAHQSCANQHDPFFEYPAYDQCMEDNGVYDCFANAYADREACLADNDDGVVPGFLRKLIPNIFQ